MENHQLLINCMQSNPGQRKDIKYRNIAFIGKKEMGLFDGMHSQNNHSILVGPWILRIYSLMNIVCFTWPVIGAGFAMLYI